MDDADDRRNSDFALADARAYPQRGRAPAPLLQPKSQLQQPKAPGQQPKPQPAKKPPQKHKSRRNKKAAASRNRSASSPKAGSSYVPPPLEEAGRLQKKLREANARIEALEHAIAQLKSEKFGLSRKVSVLHDLLRRRAMHQGSAR